MEKTKIEWCDSSWNPVTGCNYSCEYCYARSIANRYKGCLDSPSGETKKRLVVLDYRVSAKTKDGKIRNAAYPYGFTPTFHRYRLKDPMTKGFGKNIFVCSMADLFGDWIPDEWIQEVFDACKESDNHRYLFLTKNPKRYVELSEKGILPKDDIFWYGTTATTPEQEIFWSQEHHTFVSIEPILAPFDDTDGDLISKTEWAIFGVETGNRKDKIIPERSWLDPAILKFHKAGKPVFMKDSLLNLYPEGLLTEFPWND